MPESNRAEIENLIYEYFLMNYLTAIECFESAVSEDDAARESVNRLSLKLKPYLDTLIKIGKCSAFKPTERERRLQHYHQADFWRNIQKQAEESSVFYSLVHKATILYGTTSIAYVYTDDSSAPRRQEIPMSSHEHVAEFPRLDVIDPSRLAKRHSPLSIGASAGMKLIFMEYIASLNERGELDAIMPDLLSEIGFNCYIEACHWNQAVRCGCGRSQHRA